MVLADDFTETKKYAKVLLRIQSQSTTLCFVQAEENKNIISALTKYLQEKKVRAKDLHLCILDMSQLCYYYINPHLNIFN